MTVLAESSIVGEVVILIFILSKRGFLKRKKKTKLVLISKILLVNIFNREK